MSRALTAEFALAAACCRWPPSAARDAAVAAAASMPIDWSRFERVVARHRIAPLAHDGLRRAAIALPAPTAERLAQAATIAAGRALAMARETIRLQKAFEEAGIPMINVKGATLAVLAYGDLGMKQAWDVDLVVAPENVEPARALLEISGYGLDTPLDAAEFERMTGFAKECVFTNKKLGIAVELHWRLTDNRRLAPGLGVASPLQEVEIGGARVRTLAQEPLLAYLCVHGTAHGWSRLKWLADVAAYVGSAGPTEIERLYRAALSFGAGRAPAATFLLCEQLLGLAIPASLAAELAADRANAGLAHSALRCMSWRRGEAEIPYLSSATARIALSQFFMARGGRHLREEISLRWNSPADRIRWKLPRRYAFLYHLLRIPLWLGRRGRHWLGGA